MKKKLIMFVSSVMSFFAIADTAKITVAVCSAETGDPIENVRVTAWFENSIGWRAWSEPTPIVTDIKVTDRNGFSRFEGKTNTGQVSVEVRNPPLGYYKSKGFSHRFEKKSLFGTWQPDNLVVTIALDRVERPVPLYVKKCKFPTFDRAVEDISIVEKNAFAYDFAKGDWLPPWGKGEFADIVFRRLPREDCGIGVNGRSQVRPSFRDVVTIDFSGKGNGMVETPVKSASELKIRTSAVSGFISHYEQACGRGKDLQTFKTQNEAKCLCFRVRTKYDDKGNVIEAYYGKIYGDITIGWSFLGVSSVKFLYYLNPTPNDRNLEWDMKNNLCPAPGDIGNPRP